MISQHLLVVAAHPDDELLGVGGTVARLVSEGWTATALILGQGALSRDGAAAHEVQKLRDCANRAAKIIGYGEVLFESFPDNAFDTVALLDITKAVESHVARLKPTRVLTHHAHDLNIDHQRTFQAVLTATRPCNENAPLELWTFETLSATEWQDPEQRFTPNAYVDITATLEKKQQALQVYETELRPFPHPRSPEAVSALAQVRGSECVRARAEAFRVIRMIV